MSSLPLLPLAHPLILLPAARVTIPVNKDLGEAILTLIDQSDSLPIVAAIPVTTPTPDTNATPVLANWGVAARILRLVKPPARNPRQPYLVSLHGLNRIRLDTTSVNMHTHLTPHPVEYPPPDSDSIPPRALVDKFKDSALRLLDRLARDSVHQSRKEGYLKIANMMEDITDQRAVWMADVLVGSINGEYNDKLEILCTADPSTRLVLSTQFFLKQAAVSEVSKKISSAVDESLSKQQKEFFLRQQLAAIQRELHSLSSSSSSSSSSQSSSSSPPTSDKDKENNGPPSELDDDEQHETDDLLDLKRRIEAMEPGSEERKMGVREWRRLKRIPTGSVENGVIRTYLEWLTSIPWPNSSLNTTAAATTTDVIPSPSPTSISNRSFLAAARAQLDADHFGLEKIKKRLIEYLAVVRLKERREREREREVQEQEETSRTNAGAEVGDSKAMQLQVVSRTASNTNNNTNPTPSPAPKRSRPRKGVKGPILLFVGPPGTGKTSLGHSIAKALNRPFQRISLGGVRDEAEIRGHRRTYVASGPGLIVQALRKAGRRDFVLLLDEIDKIGQSNFHGDPGAALLEVLDPEQNHTFNDHYINVPIDLSQVLFICTSNTLDTISAPLLDRCEVIQLSGYTYDEKIHIARRFLLPKQLHANGLEESHLRITEPALLTMATRYTNREAGVRSLERAIGAVVRYKAVEWAEWGDAKEGQDEGKGSDKGSGSVVSAVKEYAVPVKAYESVVAEHELEKILGISRWDAAEERDREERRGVVYGLVVMGQGEGGILPVETIAVPGVGRLKLTGSLGDVIKESGELALSWVKTHAYDLCITSSRAQDPLKGPDPIDIHLHLPAGAQKKDGPSAGIAMTCALVSLLTGACVPTNVAMTGEITLRGRVTPVGGVKEKILGAHRAQITKVILPWANRKDVEHDVALEIRNQMEFVFVRTVPEALEAAFGKNTLTWRRDALVLESRL